MDQFVCINSPAPDSIFVSSPLTLSEAIGVVFVRNKTHQSWLNDYVLRRWLLGYESILISNKIPFKDRVVLCPPTELFSYAEFEKLTNTCKHLASIYSLREQERIWKWVHLHQKNK